MFKTFDHLYFDHSVLFRISNLGFQICIDMPFSHRQEKLNALLQAEINTLFQREIELPLGVIATVMKVETDRENERANVFVSIFPFSESQEILRLFARQSGRLQRLLNRRLFMERVPSIAFVLDDSNEKAERVEKLL